MRTTHLLIASVAAQVIATAGAARADFVQVIDREVWESSLSDQESIFFTFDEVPGGGFVTDQYADLGVLFTDGDDFITTVTSSKDGFGLNGLGIIRVAFDRPRTAIAVDFPGGVQYQLYSQGEVIFTSDPAGAPLGEVAFFGILADQPFDSAAIFDPGGGMALIIDNLFFGDVIPAPGAMALFGLAAISMRRRRRRGR